MQYQNKVYELGDVKNQKNFAANFIKSIDTTDILESNIQHFKPLKGEEFDGLYVKFKEGEKLVTQVIPFSSTSSKLSNFVADSCTMRCESSTWCRGCAITIIEKCKQINCECTSGMGACDPKISFP
ncbi:MAG: hypothetical protein E6Q89_02860 [Bacteroidia bacterium]|nr:MAG: hypothetical protein E6Q89_02860 [Bacteroidia bacterium]